MDQVLLKIIQIGLYIQFINAKKIFYNLLVLFQHTNFIRKWIYLEQELAM